MKQDNVFIVKLGDEYREIHYTISLLLYLFEIFHNKKFLKNYFPWDLI